MRIRDGYIQSLLCALVVSSLVSCSASRGFNRGELRASISDQRQVTDEEIQAALKARPQLPKPFKLGIYFSPPAKPDGYYYRDSWQWRGDDKDTVLASFDEFKSNGEISEVFIISDAIVEGSDNKAIRLAAARAGADAVIIVKGASDVDRYNNFLGVTYILLVTGAFVPGTEMDGLFMVNSSMWDVGNEYLYMSVEAEGEAHETRPAFFTDEERVTHSAKTDALSVLKTELSAHLEKMSTR